MLINAVIGLVEKYEGDHATWLELVAMADHRHRLLCGGHHPGTASGQAWARDIRGIDRFDPSLYCLDRMLDCRNNSLCEMGLGCN